MNISSQSLPSFRAATSAPLERSLRPKYEGPSCTAGNLPLEIWLDHIFYFLPVRHSVDPFYAGVHTRQDLKLLSRRFAECIDKNHLSFRGFLNPMRLYRFSLLQASAQDLKQPNLSFTQLTRFSTKTLQAKVTSLPEPHLERLTARLSENGFSNQLSIPDSFRLEGLRPSIAIHQQSMSCLQDVCVECPISRRNVKILRTCLPQNLQCLLLVNNGLSSGSLRILFKKEFPKLCSVSIVNNPICDAGLAMLASCLNPKTKSLTLNSLHIGVEGISSLGKLPDSLRSLDLSWNFLRGAVPVLCKQGLPKSLRILHLNSDSIDDDSFRRLFASLRPPLVLLGLSGNQLTAEAFRFQEHKFPSSLKYLDLGGNSLMDDAIAPLMGLLSEGLLLLKLDNCKLSMTSLKALLEGPLPKSLTYLNLASNHFGLPTQEIEGWIKAKYPSLPFKVQLVPGVCPLPTA